LEAVNFIMKLTVFFIIKNVVNVYFFTFLVGFEELSFDTWRLEMVSFQNLLNLFLQKKRPNIFFFEFL
jgi:hypothetical protein